MQNKKNSKNKLPSNKHTNIIKIEDIIDKIIQDNKEKLNLLNSEEIDIEEFSLKNKKRDALYYIKKKSNKKPKKNNNSKIQNEKLITKPKKGTNHKIGDNKEKSNKKIDENKEKNKTSGEKEKSNNSEKLILDFNEIKDNLLPLKSIEDEKLIDQKLIENKKADNSIEKNNDLKEKPEKVTKQHGFFKNNKVDQINEKKDEQLSSPENNLEEFKKKYGKNLIFTDVDLPEVKELSEEEIKILDETIKEFPIIDESDLKEFVPEEVEPKAKVKKSFFKKRKPAEPEGLDLGKEDSIVESEVDKTFVDDKSLNAESKGENLKKWSFNKNFFKKRVSIKDQEFDSNQKDNSVESNGDIALVNDKIFEDKNKEDIDNKKWNFSKSIFKKRESIKDQEFDLNQKDNSIESNEDIALVDDKSLNAESKDKNLKKWSFNKNFFKKKESIKNQEFDSNNKDNTVKSVEDNALVDDKAIKVDIEDKKKIKKGRFGKSLFKIKKSSDIDNINFDKKGTFFKYDNLEDLIPVHPIEDEKFIEQKLEEDIKTDDSVEKNDSLENKADLLAKQHGFFKNKKVDKINEKKDEQLSKPENNLEESKKKDETNLIIDDLNLNKTDESKNEILDEKIKEFPIIDESDLKEFVPEEVEPKAKVKKSFFKKRKPAEPEGLDLGKEDSIVDTTVDKTLDDDKSLKVDLKEKARIWKGKKEKPKKNLTFLKKEKPPKDIDNKQKEIKHPKLMKKPNFRVNFLTRKNEINNKEKAVQDEKIKDSSEVINNKGKELKGESEALKLASKHLKDTSKSDDKKTVLEQKETQASLLFSEEKSDREHVFFDEEESSSGGWTPQLSHKAKKALTLPNPVEGEITNENIKAHDDIELPKEVLQTKSVKLTDLGFSENEWEELDFYSLFEPFAYVEILREKESLDKCYFLVENALTEEEENILNFIEETLSSMDIDTLDLENKNESDYLISRLEEVIQEYNINIDEESKNKIFYYIGKSSLGLDKIDPLMRDPNIEDISCDGADVPIFLYHRKYGSLKSNIKFDTEDELSAFVFKLAQKCGKHISIAEPMLDATMPDGSRIQMTLSDEITAKGSTFTIRKFRADPFSPPDLVEFNTMSSEMIAFMWMAVENGINTLFAGGTASGKTTALNALTLFIPRESKIVSIEETREINLPHPNWIPGVARSGFGEVVADRVIGEIDMYDLMKAALRQRPEYILVGEIRGREAYVLFQAMATGHATYSTAHADSAQSLIHRLEGKPINIPRVMLQSLDIVCLHVITRVKNIRARRCKQIIEIIDIDPTTKEILTNEVFRWDPVEDKFIYSGKSYVLERIRAEKDMTREEMTNEIKNRKLIVEWMNKKNVREFRDVSKLVSQYSESPEETLEMIKKGDKKINA